MANLFRPVGLKELELIWNLEFRGFPPRLEHQSFFYPVLNIEYAREIATKWNVADEASGFSGYVTRFAVRDDYLASLERRVVGASTHQEYWVPAERLPEFNDAIVGTVAIDEAFFGPKFIGCVPDKFGLTGMDAERQFVTLAKTWPYSLMDFAYEAATNARAIYINSWFWVQHDFTGAGVSEQEKTQTLTKLREAWECHKFDVPLPWA